MLRVRTSGPDKVSVTRLFYKLTFLKSFLALCEANDAKAIIVSVFTGAVFMNDREWRMRSYVTIFSLHISFREGATILAGYAIHPHGYFSFSIWITAYLFILLNNHSFFIVSFGEEKLIYRTAW